MKDACSNGFRRAALTAVAGGLSLVVVLMSGAPAAAAASKQATPQRYVRGVCGALTTWIEETVGSDEDMWETVDALADDTMKVTKAKAKAVALASSAVRATDALIEKTKSIGTPNIEGGAQLAEDHLAVLSEIRGEYASLATATTKVKAANAASLANDLRALATEASTEFYAIGNPLETLQADATLEPIIDSEGECGAVVDSYAVNTDSFGFVVGDCIDGFDVVDCAGPHDYEVYLVTSHPASADEPFPGNSALTDYGDQTCTPAYEAYVGVPLADSDHTYLWLAPDAELWEAGDREVVCGVSNVSEVKLTGSLKGSSS